MKKLIFLVELVVMNETQISSHYILVRAENEDAACEFATDIYKKKQKAGDIIINTWVEPFFENEDDYLMII